MARVLLYQVDQDPPQAGRLAVRPRTPHPLVEAPFGRRLVDRRATPLLIAPSLSVRIWAPARCNTNVAGYIGASRKARLPRGTPGRGEWTGLTMIFCYSVLTPIVVVVRTLIQVAREIVRTVCDWVSSTITTIKTIVEEVCTWLPWPLDELCELVTKTIEVVETIWDWVCHDVIETVIDWVEQITEYVFYILRWICWVLTWLTRGPALLLCILGLRPRRFLAVCIKVLTDRDGTPAVDWPKVDQDIEQARQILANCNIELVVIGRERIEKPEFMDGTTCDFGGMFTRFFTWFAANECSDCSAVTVYYVRNIPDAIGCAYPGTNWVTVASDGDGRTMVQEIGHLADLWGHSDDPDNVMTDQGGGSGDQITRFQCCMFRTSRFARLTPCAGMRREGEAPAGLGAEPAPQEVRGTHAFRRLGAKEPQSARVLRERIVQAAIAAAIVYTAGRRLSRRIRGG